MIKKLISLSTLSLAIATMNLPAIAQGQEIQYDKSAPRISSTTGLPDRHYIRLYTGEQPLSSITIRPSDFMDLGENIQVTDEAGETIAAEVSKEEDRVKISFAQPVASGTTLEIAMMDIGFAPPMPPGQVFHYQVSGDHVGFMREIPYGLARVQVF
ncbi:hypothetical protein [Nodularia spumigena]|uniref:hypothetical protein n=1 Tax=Nodularia spumigena TaxID=70799 RepID=UPI00232D1F41|nr:hypothetical protein [Nodularia spumigena]MDB9316180.1 hypothetical protein [Nodularia spumigena CS-590/01A]MDB9320863.1 hypothetical protein [Nodularia spumigena CS-591/07A]MDB9327833.1 hypothetical protein [Nodularia spumigena CS-590/02]MDB9331483.1 hypothetical protein [Nodularia spumigena CS-591/04]MDB9337152.1 hypothetical protein [Nodularia spumigena CS-590/01]